MNNFIALVGTVGAAYEEATNNLGKEQARFSLAINERRKDESGQWVSLPPVWVNVVATGFALAVAKDIARKGARLSVMGKCRIAPSINEQAKSSVSITVYADSVALIPRKEEAKAKAQEEDPWAEPNWDRPDF